MYIWYKIKLMDKLPLAFSTLFLSLPSLQSDLLQSHQEGKQIMYGVGEPQQPGAGCYRQSEVREDLPPGLAWWWRWH